MSADFATAERASDDAVANGASAGEVRLLRGQVALHRGNSKEALEHLEEAARLLPESVAAQAILRRAYFDAGQSDRFYVSLAALGKLTPETAEDHLFLGQALGSGHVPERALPLLDRAVEMRDSPIARLVRADILTRAASDTGSRDQLERSLAEARVVKALLPRHAIAAVVSLDTHLHAACAYEILKEPQKRQAALEQAGREAAALQDHPPFARAVRVRMLYFDYVNDQKAIQFEHERAKGTPGAPLAGRTYFHSLFRQARFAEALAVLDQSPTPGDRAMNAVRRAFTLAHLPDGPARALAIYREFRAERQGQPYDGRLDLYPTFILHLLGRKQEAMESMRGVTLKVRHRAAQHLAGLMTAEELIAGQTLRHFQCELHFFVAMNLLAGGDRVAARAHFEKSVAARVLWFLEYEWSRSFLAQLDRDPNWPPWTPPKK
jgi:tetratricopeptide (TPR) repeat protein